MKISTSLKSMVLSFGFEMSQMGFHLMRLAGVVFQADAKAQKSTKSTSPSGSKSPRMGISEFLILSK